MWKTENDGVTLNDRSDADNGPNLLQNFPVLDTYAINGTVLSVTGSLTSVPNTQYWIDFFVSKTCDPSGYSEGENYRKSIQVTTNAIESVAFAIDLTKVPTTMGYLTATNPDGNTSEFSKCLQIPHWVYLPVLLK